MEFRQLRYFIAVADSGSYSKAAQNLYVTQPALSQQIAKLEYDLGVTLLERSTRSVRMTAAGRDLYQRAIPFLRDMENMVQAVRTTNERGYINQRISIAMEDGLFSLEYTGLYAGLREVRKKYPEVELSFQPVQMDNVSRLLQEGMIDLVFGVISSTASLSPNVEELELRRGQIALAVPCDWDAPFGSPEFHRRMNSANFYFPEQRDRWSGVVTNLLGENDCHPRYTTVCNYNTAINYVAMGAGVCFAPEIHLRNGAPDLYNVLEFPNKSAEYRVSAFYQKNNGSYLLERFIADIPKAMAQLGAGKTPQSKGEYST